VEAVVAVTADAVAGSIALIGFGLDSLVEMSSGLVILWQFLHPVPESRERMALRPIGLSFFALAIYISGIGAQPDRRRRTGALTGRDRVGRGVTAMRRPATAARRATAGIPEATAEWLLSALIIASASPPSDISRRSA